MLDHERWIFRLDVDAGAHRAATDAEIAQKGRGHLDALEVAVDRDAVRAELLAEPDRHRVLQMRATALQHVVELLALGEERIAQLGNADTRSRARASAPRRMAVGITSLVDCAMLT